ncbi:MutT/nudix family protein [Geomicrobium sp. JCM 19037]|uniref:8-oxo-dGTP diphosphatase n=1 Tax=Geomicrobium sp. JCM 19037 TaxID=1460634 RepID=UPI00045F1ED5|nr:8-oxo-dGTP diphosphatase [Geomicrobium sp. JCM 19037]GAK03953.1 MutT/nudix family protein [Geomicrobium sp. JCM 19037]
MPSDLNVKFWTICLIRDGDYVLLLDRTHDEFKGFIPPGGKVAFPESFTSAAIREVYEETGLHVWDLTYKGIYEFVNPVKKDRYMIFNYMTEHFSGELTTHASEGKPNWIHIEDVEHLPMQPSIRRRFPYFFKEGTFEIHVVWDEENDQEGDIYIERT